MRALQRVSIGIVYFAFALLDRIWIQTKVEHSRGGHRDLADLEIEASTQNSERFLFEDDDRHSNDPDEEDVTDNPTIFGYSRSPSSRPSTSPTQPPSAFPTVTESLFPSLSPTLDPCKGDDGDYGNTDGGISITVFFSYGVESDKILEKSLLATLSDQVKNVEQKLLNLLIAIFFEECNLRRTLRGQNIFLSDESTVESSFEEYVDKAGKRENPATANNAESAKGIIGISSSPVDLANGKRCTGDYTSELITECHVIEGRLTVYLSDVSIANDTNLAFVEATKAIMDADLLDDSHPAILSVMFMTPSKISLPLFADDDLFEEETLVVSGPAAVLMIAIAAIVMAVALTSVTRYRYSQLNDEESGELKTKTMESSERFVEIESNDSVMAYINMASRSS